MEPGFPETSLSTLCWRKYTIVLLTKPGSISAEIIAKVLGVKAALLALHTDWHCIWIYMHVRKPSCPGPSSTPSCEAHQQSTVLCLQCCMLQLQLQLLSLCMMKLLVPCPLTAYRHATLPLYCPTDRYLHNRGADPGVERGLLQGGEADSRSKMRPDMMIVEMTAAEQQIYVPHDDTTGTAMPTLTARLHNGRARRIWIVEGGYCSDTRYEDKLKEKEGQYQAMQTALEDRGYQVSTLPIILGVSGSHIHSTTDAFNQLGTGHDAINTLMIKLHEHSIPCLHNIVTSRRVLERTTQSQVRKLPP